MIGIDIDNSIEKLSIPIAIIEYNNKILYNSYTVLENQLSQMDPSQDPDGYHKLESITQSIFDSWVVLGYRTMEGHVCDPRC